MFHRCVGRVATGQPHLCGLWGKGTAANISCMVCRSATLAVGSLPLLFFACRVALRTLTNVQRRSTLTFRPFCNREQVHAQKDQHRALGPSKNLLCIPSHQKKATDPSLAALYPSRPNSKNKKHAKTQTKKKNCDSHANHNWIHSEQEGFDRSTTGLTFPRPAFARPV